MAVTASSYVTFTLLCCLPVLFSQKDLISDVSLRPLKPKGLIVSMKDPMINFFSFEGKVNSNIEINEAGDISIVVNKPHNGFWTGQDNDVELKVGDVISYYIHVGISGQQGQEKKLTYVVKELFDSEQPSQLISQPKPGDPNRVRDILTSGYRPSTCGKTATMVSSRSLNLPQTICASQIIFEDNFDTLREDLWTIEQYIPSKPEYPFVSYQKTTVSVKNGILRIKPQLQDNLPGFNSITILSGNLDLSNGCTRAGSCVYHSSGPQILHPIASGRITSNNAFVFKYGFVEVRAKLPQGDWLYPDILLESFLKCYNYDDHRVLRIAGARGNVQLRNGREECGNRVLYGGPTINAKCPTNLFRHKMSTTEWGNDFHVYSLRWSPEMVTLSVDEEEWGRIKSTDSSLLENVPRGTCKPVWESLETHKTSFDDFFGIILGVSAGGIIHFPDSVISGETTSKPWSNYENKARVNFYKDKDTWERTWTQSELLVDYIRVRAL